MAVSLSNVGILVSVGAPPLLDGATARLDPWSAESLGAASSSSIWICLVLLEDILLTGAEFLAISISGGRRRRLASGI